MTDNPAKVMNLGGSVRLYEDMPKSDGVICADYVVLRYAFQEIIYPSGVVEIWGIWNGSNELFFDGQC